MSNIEKLRAVRAELDALHERRNDLIRLCVAEGKVSKAEVARSAGLTYQHVWRLTKDAD